MKKPDIWNTERAKSFLDFDTVEAYQYRAPYPAEVFRILSGLITDSPRMLLDAGCGRGEIARNMVNHADRIDAVDFSRAIIEAGRKLSGGNNPKLNWIHGKVEEAALNPPYSLIAAGHSLHWFDWEVVMPRFAEILTPNGFLAVVGNVFEDFPWTEELRRLRVKYLGYETARPNTVVQELEDRNLFKVAGEKETSEITHSNSMYEYTEQYHSRSDMARIQIGEDGAAKFDAELLEIVSRYHEGDSVCVKYRARITWGKPLCSY